MYICPKCQNKLTLSSQTYKCPQGHCFDLSSKGYVNLLLSGKSGIHGDSKEMLVSRREFLSMGYYAPIIKELGEILAQKFETAKEITILDAGCGEGYYSDGLRNELETRGISATIYGIDVSKDGVAMAAKKYKQCSFSVASVNALPFPSESFDAVVSLFAPIAENEFDRVLKKQGVLVTVSPSPKHLFGLKKAVYDTPYENEETTFTPTLFDTSGKKEYYGEITLRNSTEIANLFKMTPYYHKTGTEGKEKLAALNSLDTEIGFMFYNFNKKQVQ